MGLDLEERGWEETSPGTILKVIRALLVGSTARDNLVKSESSPHW